MTDNRQRALRLGKRIQKRREELGLTQADLAKTSKVTQGHISQIERGERMPTLATLMKLRAGLGLTDGEFTDWLNTAA